MNCDPMPIEARSFPTNEVVPPSSAQLEKIVDSLEFLINIQIERDETEQKALASIEAELVALREAVSELQFNQREAQDVNPTTGYAEAKNSILAQYGLLDESDECQSELEPINAILPDVIELSEAPVEELDNELTIPMTEQDAADVAKLKDELRQKLRDAEVEMSIRRAKLIQQKADYEEREAQLIRAQRLKNNLESDHADKRQGILTRLKRQLRGITKPQPNVVNDTEPEQGPELEDKSTQGESEMAG